MFRRQGRQSRRNPGLALAALFTPKSLSNLTLWLRADLGIVGGASPTAWNDQSGAGNNLANTGGSITWSATSGPNSQAGVTLAFAGGAGALTGSGHPATGSIYSLHMVWKTPGTGAFDAFVLGSTTKVSLGINATPARLMKIGANFQTDSTSNYANAFEAWSWVSQGGGVQSLVINGSVHTLSGNIANGTPDANIALSSGGASAIFSEVIVQNGQTTAAEQTSINAYFARYGL